MKEYIDSLQRLCLHSTESEIHIGMHPDTIYEIRKYMSIERVQDIPVESDIMYRDEVMTMILCGVKVRMVAMDIPKKKGIY